MEKGINSSVVKIAGGLGNQLFQYAFGKVLEKKLGASTFFDVQTVGKSKNFTSRSLDIEKLGITVPVPTFAGMPPVFTDGILHRVERKLVQKLPWMEPAYIVQKNAHYRHSIRPGAYYDGYWQLCEYPDSIRENLLKDISYDAVHLKHQSLIETFASEDSVAIHIRRSDYINIPANAKIFEICEMDYYEAAIASIRTRFPKAKFYIFSQDTEWVQANFNAEIFQTVSGNPAIDDMLLMSLCKHNIIANSTFSWWSAWLNKNVEKVVVAPKKWYKGTMNAGTSQLIPQNWVRL